MKKTLTTVPAVAPVLATPPTASAVAPVVDLLRVQGITNLEKTLPPMEAEALREQLVDLIDRSLQELCISDVQQVAQFADLCLNDDGCNTPAEDFITMLVAIHYLRRGLTPDVAAFRLDEFRENFDMMMKAARIFTARYPEAVKPAA